MKALDLVCATSEPSSVAWDRNPKSRFLREHPITAPAATPIIDSAAGSGALTGGSWGLPWPPPPPAQGGFSPIATEAPVTMKKKAEAISNHRSVFLSMAFPLPQGTFQKVRTVSGSIAVHAGHKPAYLLLLLIGYHKYGIKASI
jgi:hypothetical protein